MSKFLVILVLTSPILWACACVFSDNCDESEFPQHEDEYWKDAECLDQRKYDDCMEQYRFSQLSDDFNFSEDCRKQASYRCIDRKSSSSKKKW